MISLFTDLLQAQSAPVKEWDRRFGGTEDDRVAKVFPTADGGYLLAGTSSSGINGDKTAVNKGGSDYWVVKISSNGTKQWDKTFGGSSSDYLSSAIQTSDGGYLLGGYSYSGMSGDKTEAGYGEGDYWVVKITSNGVKQWDKTFGGSDTDDLFSAIQTSDGGYLLGGKSESGISGDKTAASKGLRDYWVVKITSSGVKQWDKSYGTEQTDDLTSLLQASDGGYLLGGMSVEDNSNMDKTGVGQRWIIKVNSIGNKQWDISMDPAVDYPWFLSIQEDMLQMTDGGYLAIGTFSTDVSDVSTRIHKISNNGQIIWSKEFKTIKSPSVERYEAELVTGFQTPDGGFILAGSTDAGAGEDVSQPGRGESDFWVVKTTRQIQPGEIVMSNGSTGVSPGNTYYDPGFVANYQDNLDVTQRLSARAGFKLRLTFTSFQLENNYYDKLYIYDGTSTSAPLIGVYSGSNSPGTITSSGGSLTFRFVSDGLINYPGWVANISYIPIGARLAAEEVAGEETQETLLKLEAFPNPFKERITLNFTVQQTGPVNLRIYNSKGLEAANLFAGEMQAGETKSVEWQPKGQQEGVYIVRLGTPGKVITNKIVLVR